MFQLFSFSHLCISPLLPTPLRPTNRASLIRTSKCIVVVLFCASFARPAHAGRPMATDDADVLDPGACQLETWNEHSRGQNLSWLNPSCNPFGATEFALGAARQRQDGAPASNLYSWQIKHLLRKYEEDSPGYALALGAQRDLAAAATDTFIKGIMSLPLAGENLLAHVNAGVVRQRREMQNDYRGSWGIALDGQVHEGTRVSLETYAVTAARANWQLGVRHELIPGRLRIDASVGSPYGRWSNGRVVTVGLVFVTPDLRR